MVFIELLKKSVSLNKLEAKSNIPYRNKQELGLEISYNKTRKFLL